MAVNPRAVDNYFGADTFGHFQYLQARGGNAVAIHENDLKKTFGMFDGGLSFRLGTIQYMLASVELAFDQLMSGKNISVSQFWDVIEALEAGIDCADAEIGQLRAVQALGLVAMLTPLINQFPRRELKSAAEAERNALKALDKALDEAKSKRIGAVFDKLIDVAQLVVPLAREMKLIEDVAAGFGGLMADSMLGPDGPDSSKAVRTGITSFEKPLSKLAGFTKAFGIVTKGGVALNGVYDVLDFDELKTAFSNVDKLRDAIALERKWRKYIIEVIWAQWGQRVQSFQNQLEQADRQMKETAYLVEQQKNEFWKRETKSGYKPYMIWKLER